MFFCILLEISPWFELFSRDLTCEFRETNSKQGEISRRKQIKIEGFIKLGTLILRLKTNNPPPPNLIPSNYK